MIAGKETQISFATYWPYIFCSASVSNFGSHGSGKGKRHDNNKNITREEEDATPSFAVYDQLQISIDSMRQLKSYASVPN